MIRKLEMTARTVIALGLGFICVASGLPAAGQEIAGVVPTGSDQGPAALSTAVNEFLSLTTSTIQPLPIVEDAAGTLSTTVLLEGQPRTLRLKRHSVRSADFHVLVQDASGDLHLVTPPPIITFKGIVVEIPGAQVRASIDGAKMKAVIYTPTGVYGVEPVSEMGLDGSGGKHAVYQASDWVNREDYKCGTENAPALAPLPALGDIGDLGEGSTAGTGLKVADLALDADVEFYQANGSSVDATVQDMENIINGIEPYYEVPAIAITYEITTVIVRTAGPDPYTSFDPGGLLDEFQNHWNSSPQSLIRRDTAHLFTGRNINGTVIGIAYLGVVCNSSWGYGLSQSRFSGNFTSRLGLTAHEIGHNWNASHCDGCGSCASCCRIMCSGLGGCTGILTSFGCEEVAEISGFKNTRTCLSDLATAVPLPFSDNFPSAALDTAKWSYNNGGAISALAVSPPSAPNALQLNASGSELYRDDDIRTNFILLSGESNATLSYYTEHRGVENGEQLIVEYWRNTRNWVTLNTITSTGSDQSAFVSHLHILPPDAHHNEFRVRFRPEVNEINDTWYIDDVRVSGQCSGDEDCDDDLYCNGVESCVNQQCEHGSNPCSFPLLCKESNDTCVECLVNADCSDGQFCTGVEMCSPAGECGPGADPCTTPENPACDPVGNQCVQCMVGADCPEDGLHCTEEVCIDMFCAIADPCTPLACFEPTDSCITPGEMQCVLSSATAVPGGSVRVDLFLDEVRPLRGYQSTLGAVGTSGSGTATIDCPNGVAIDASRPDFVFFNRSNYTAADCLGDRAAGALVSGSVSVLGAPKYIATYTLEVSAGSTPGSTFDIDILPNPASYLRDANNSNLNFTVDSPCASFTVVPLICDPPVVVAAGPRSLSITPAAAQAPIALRVTSSTWACVSTYVQADGTQGPDPVFQLPSAWGTVYARGAEITPSASYIIEADCDAAFSTIVSATTAGWGDITADGIVDLDDILCELDAFGGSFTNCSLAANDLAPCAPDGQIDLDDILAVLDAFGAAPYPCPPPC